MLDGYTESDFHLGGTNAKGYFVTGNFGLFDNVWLTGRWLSADQVYGPRFGIDVLQLDLNASF
ncbi:putative porin [Hankyongella ginsenosidimutans]|uniref:putative porin n=1 Tax=Hankyongella ginsenosidimutans TaxID=1763828 RepID=UPI001FE65367|nr:putative porin [Hankyongella ginsenosidimutans]